MLTDVTHYFIAEGLIGEDSIWRVVRAEVSARGLPVYAFVATCQTRRAALSLSSALNERRSVAPEVVEAAARYRAGWQAAPQVRTPSAYNILPGC